MIRSGTDPRASPFRATSGSDPQPRILMAEDNVINQRVAMLILRRAGFSIDLVADGSEAVAAHRKQRYDLILMDCQMPIMDGFEASRMIRELDGPQPVIVAVTANAMEGEREKCLNAGMNDYLPKPFQADHLVALVRRWCGSIQHQEASSASA